MKKIYLRFYSIADYEEEAAWLNEQHKKGLKLSKTFPPFIFIFEKCEPEDVIYKLEFKNTKVTSDYIKMYDDYGWEYFNSCVGWNYFRKPAAATKSENESELFSDKESKVEMIDSIYKKRLLPIMIIFFSCVIPNLRFYYTREIYPFGISFATFFSLIFVFYVYVIIHCGIKLRKLKKELTE